MTSNNAFWDKIAERYAAMPVGNQTAYEQTVERVASHLNASDQVVEVGCGTATTALALAPKVARMLATDASAEMVRIGREKAEAQDVENIEILQAGIDDPRLATGQHDAVMAFSLLHLVDDLDATLVQVARMLKPGGLFISKTPCLRAMWYLRPVLPVLRLMGKAPGGVAFFSPEVLEAAIRRAGFEIVETGDYPAKTPPRRFVVARKG
ncbi:class I SAM-dependent methyltransferase [Roseovarius sp. A21]|uniref:Class I SAM-dependent methyltransferase n=1 Tax=Roseovarius bejariae TaxID=2576383 RepID=A0A844CNE3_9RHOB|nr:class I SAM-dependent methyltransferase [Roseovarius bejariae]MRU16871.1 class I SAM-dependent methyltransferase [Roseovarius bejariae]